MPHSYEKHNLPKTKLIGPYYGILTPFYQGTEDLATLWELHYKNNQLATTLIYDWASMSYSSLVAQH